MTFENSNGVWFNYTYDSNINVLAYENSRGDWYKHTRDSFGNLLTYEGIAGLITYIAGDSQHGLYYEDGLYIAGCRRFSYDQAVTHWTHRAQEDDEVVRARATKFLDAIHKHHTENTISFFIKRIYTVIRLKIRTYMNAVKNS